MSFTQSQSLLYFSRFTAVLLLLGLVGCQTAEPELVASPVSTLPVQPQPTSTANLVPSDAPQLSTSTAMATSTPTETLLPSLTFTPSPVPDWGKSKVIFDLTERSFGEMSYQGIFILDFDSGYLKELLGSGYQLLDVSPNFQHLLVANEERLFLVDQNGQTISELADNYLYSSPWGARWLKDSDEIIYISVDQEGSKINQVNSQGTENNPLILDGNPIQIYPSTQDTIVWAEGHCNPFGNCTRQGIVWSNNQGKEITSREKGQKKLLICQTPSQFVFAEQDDQDIFRFHIQPLDEQIEKLYWLTEEEYADCAWSPNKEQLSLVAIERGWYSGTIHDARQLLVDVKSGEYTLLPERLGWTTQSIWSPDGHYLLFTGTEQVDDQYQVLMRLMDMNTWMLTLFDEKLGFNSSNYLSINHIFWLP